MRPAKCHPSRPVLAKDLCATCYRKARRHILRAAKDPNFIKRRERTFDKTPPRDPRATPKQGHPNFATVTLALRHSFNGKFYGPGTVKVPFNKANIFLRAEQEAGEKEYSLQQQQAFIINMAGGAPSKRQVPWAQFDQYLSQS